MSCDLKSVLIDFKFLDIDRTNLQHLDNEDYKIYPRSSKEFLHVNLNLGSLCGSVCVLELPPPLHHRPPTCFAKERDFKTLC